MSVPPSVEAEERAGRRLRTLPFLPHFLLREVFGWTVALLLLAALAAFMPWELGRRADPFASAPAGIRPEWYFLWMFQLLKFMPATVLGQSGELLVIVPLGLVAVLALLLPLVHGDRPEGRRTVRVLAALAALLMAILTVYALTLGARQT